MALYKGNQKICPVIPSKIYDATIEYTGTSSGTTTYKSHSGYYNLVISGVSSITTRSAYERKYENNTNILSIGFPSLTSVSGSMAFYSLANGCSNLKNISFPLLKTVSTDTCVGAFGYCPLLEDVVFPELTTVGTNGFLSIFIGDTGLKYIYFPKLNNLTTDSLKWAFYGCVNIKDVYFNSLKTTSFSSSTAFDMMLFNTGTSCVHTIHFPSNLESKVSTLTGYPLFGGTSGYVVLAFDLPATS